MIKTYFKNYGVAAARSTNENPAKPQPRQVPNLFKAFNLAARLASGRSFDYK